MIRKFERTGLKFLRSGYTMIKPKVNLLTISEPNQVNQFIYERLLDDKAFMCGRLGTEFFACTYPYVLNLPIIHRYLLFIKGYSSIYRKDVEYAQRLVDTFCCNCGFFPNDVKLLDNYSELAIDDLNEVDLLGVFFSGREKLFGNLISHKEICLLENLEPYDYKIPWSKALEGKKVLVVHPFAKSIESQYARRELLWDNPDVLPAFELKTIKAVQTIAGEKAPFKDWFEALEYMKSQMDAMDYDVAIIGCGAYGFHLAAHAKRTGHKAIHLGGATQILFGIKGKRWEELPAVSKFFNEYWVSPLPEETPKNNARVEGGCYW